MDAETTPFAQASPWTYTSGAPISARAFRFAVNTIRAISISPESARKSDPALLCPSCAERLASESKRPEPPTEPAQPDWPLPTKSRSPLLRLSCRAKRARPAVPARLPEVSRWARAVPCSAPAISGILARFLGPVCARGNHFP